MKIWQCRSDSYLELHLVVFKESEVQVVFQPTEGDKQVERYVLFVIDMTPTGLPLNWRSLDKNPSYILQYNYILWPPNKIAWERSYKAVTQWDAS